MARVRYPHKIWHFGIKIFSMFSNFKDEFHSTFVFRTLSENQAALRAAQSGAPATEKTETPLISSYGA